MIASARLCNEGFQIKKEHLNKRLVPYTLLDVTFPGHHDCARECFNFGGECKAINYNRKNKKCELKYKGRDSVDISEFEQDGDYIFSDISEWPKLTLNGCSAQQCKDNQRCLPLGNSDFLCVDKADCGTAPSIEHGNVSAPITTDGAIATYSCKFGYEMVDDVMTRICKGGSWTTGNIMCTLKDCGSLAAITYGVISAPVTTHGGTATYTCIVGYKITSGDSSRTCVDGVWDGVHPTCTIKDCGSLPSILHGSIYAPESTHGATVNYECVFGYQITSGSSTRTCSDGIWTGSEAVCSAIPNVGCYVEGSSGLYRGTTRHTASGILCQRWDEQTPHGHVLTNDAQYPDTSITEAENYCRNPEPWVAELWCYTTDPSTRWEYCSVPKC